MASSFCHSSEISFSSCEDYCVSGPRRYDVQVLNNPPEADIILIGKRGEEWTDEQRARLPDGIRDSSSSQILIEFKYTQSVNKWAFLQTLVYDTLYRLSEGLEEGELQTFLVSSKTVQKKTLDAFGYHVRLKLQEFTVATIFS